MADFAVALPGVAIARATPAPLWVLHCAPGDAAALSDASGLALGTTMLRATETGEDAAALHVAPDEWLLVGGDPRAALAATMIPHALVDVGDRSLAVTVAGPLAAAVLNAGCPLDLGDAAFPAGACTRTLFGKADVVLWRHGNVFRVDYGRSFDAYVTGLLAVAAAQARA